MSSPDKRGVKFTRDSAQRIARVVAKVERGVEDLRGQRIRTAYGDDPERLRICKTTDLWEVNEKATLDVWETGDPKNPTQTAGQTLDAYNLTHEVPAETFVLVAKAENGEYYLVEQDSWCDDGGTVSKWLAVEPEEETTDDWLTGTGPQALLNVNGCATWVHLKKQTMVTKVEFDGYKLKVYQSEVYVLELDPSKSTGTPPEPTYLLEPEKITMVKDVTWADGIVVTKKEIAVFPHESEPADTTIIESTDCTPPA